jgi:Zn-dependent M32 family carboxypeptidase
MLSKRQENLYQEMKEATKSNYEQYNHYNWTVTMAWQYEKNVNDFILIKQYINQQIKRLESDHQLNIVNYNQYNNKLAMYNQLIKLCNKRIEILTA